MLEIQNISKTYGDRKVLDDVSFTVEPGKLTGFVGGNGAGKTTTMRTILGVVKPDSGVVTISGRPVAVTDRARFGYMPEERGLYPKMKVKEQVTYFAELHGLSAREAASNADRFLEDLGLTERSGDNVEDLSLGNQQRAQIAASLAHEPEILILDEPFSGLDPLAVEVVLETLQGFAARGVPVLFSSHQLDVVERLSDNLVIISGGAIRASGDRNELQERHSEGMHRISLAGDAGWLRDETGITVLEFDRGDAIFVADSGETAQRILRTALDRGPVFGFGRHIVKLSDIYREVVA